jgi:SAM-dependent methyltransferase
VFNVPAEFYDRFVGRYSASLGDELIAFAGIEPGMRVLDVGCGPGGLTRRLVDLGCTVKGCDPSETFSAAAAERVPEAEVVHASAEDLPFEDASFDAVLAQLVVNFMADPEAGASEMARVTTPGGKVAACVWDYAGEMTLMRNFWDAACEVEPERGAAANEAVTMRFGRDDDGLRTLWASAGLRDVRTAGLVAHASYTDFEDLWAPLPAGTGPGGAFTVSLDTEKQQELHDAFRRRLGVGDEPFELTARAWAAAGVAP